MNIFVDTNVLLGLYQLSGPDLDELLKLTKLAETKKLSVFLSQQVADEFWRNRERVVKEALDAFGKTGAQQTLPNLIRVHPECAELQKAVAKVNDLVKQLKGAANLEIEKHELKADGVVEALFKQCPPAKMPGGILDRALVRCKLGNPPGKAGSHGDAINWEWLLHAVPQGEDLTIVSTDSDFESDLLKASPKEFLSREWRQQKGAHLFFFKTLPDFLKTHFPDIKLSGEIDKAVAIEALENSLSFAATHKAIARLNQFGDFTDGDVIRIATAYETNNQIQMIFGDDDVLNFAKKIVQYAKSDDAKKALESIEILLEQLDPAEDSEEIPF